MVMRGAIRIRTNKTADRRRIHQLVVTFTKSETGSISVALSIAIESEAELITAHTDHGEVPSEHREVVAGCRKRIRKWERLRLKIRGHNVEVLSHLPGGEASTVD